MNVKFVWRLLLLVNVCIWASMSCKDDKEEELTPSAPSIVIQELGSGHDSPNDLAALAGSDLHIEALITADGLIARIDLEIHQEEGGSFTIEKSYTEGKYIGVKNTEFHEHIDIPAETPPGEYHLHLTVTDQAGQTATVESELDIQRAPVELPIEGLTFGAGHDFPDNQIAYLGTAPVIGADNITSEYGIERIVVELHSEGDTAPFEMDTTFVYNGENKLTAFQKHILIPADAPSGDYHLHFHVYDTQGNLLEKALEISVRETGIRLADIEIGHDNSALASNIHTEFKVTATDPLASIRVCIYKAEAPADYFFDETFPDDFASGDVKEYTFHKHLSAPKAVPGEYILEIRVNDTKGAYLVVKENVSITAG
jgi:hypothetical protein